jgi:outer membrane protein OmpA-like peptidoglycan-associated protein
MKMKIESKTYWAIKLVLLAGILHTHSAELEALEFNPYIQLAPSAYVLDLEYAKNDLLVGLASDKSQTTMGGAFVGLGAQLHQNFAIELRLGGSVSKSGTIGSSPYSSQVKLPMASIFFKPEIPFEDWSVYGLLGATTVPKYQSVADSLSLTVSQSQAALSYGVGASYRINDSLNLGLEWVAYHKQKEVAAVSNFQITESLKARLSGISLALNYRFGVGGDEREEVEVYVPAPVQEPAPQVVVPEAACKPCVCKCEPKQDAFLTARSFVLEGVQFEHDSSVLLPTSSEILDEVVGKLKSFSDVRVKISGFTNSLGSDEYNLWLSKRRAESVVNYLVNHGISPSRLSSEGYGESHPIADNQTKEGRSKNRRVELTVLR